MGLLFAASNNSIIHEIQSEILDDKVRVSNIVRKARLAARKLDLQDFEKWLVNESDGYKDVAAKDLPEYRKIGATPRFWNPYRGWCPIIIEDGNLYDLCHTSFLFQAIEELENLATSSGDLIQLSARTQSNPAKWHGYAIRNSRLYQQERPSYTN